MKTVYVDDMFLLNLVINYFILLATAKLCALPLKRGRFAAAAAAGGIYSVLSLFPQLGFLGSLPVKLCLGALMTLISFNGARRLWRPFIAFLCVSAAFGGAVFAASLLAGADMDGGLYINPSLRVLSISFAVCYLGLTLVFKQLSRRRLRETLEVTVVLGETSASFKALKDTGNELYDPISGLPILVAELGALDGLFPPEASSALELGAAYFLSTVSENSSLKTRFRLVPYTSAGVSHGLLPVFRPERLLIGGQEHSDVLVGLCGHRLSPDDEFSAVF